MVVVLDAFVTVGCRFGGIPSLARNPGPSTVAPVARQFASCAFFTSSVILIARNFFFSFRFSSTTSPRPHPTHQIPNHGSSYAPSLFDPEGLAKGILVRLQEHCLHGGKMLLLQIPGTAASGPRSAA